MFGEQTFAQLRTSFTLQSQPFISRKPKILKRNVVLLLFLFTLVALLPVKNVMQTKYNQI